MRRNYIILMIILLTTLPLSSYGEMQRIDVPTQSWGIVFDAPALLKFKGNSNKSEFRYLGSSENGFVMSVFVEDKKNDKKGNLAVYKHYWPLTKKNPKVDKTTVKVKKYKRFIKVSYMVKGVHEKIGTYEIPHENYFFTFNGKWVDVHISQFPNPQADSQIFKNFIKTLTYKPF